MNFVVYIFHNLKKWFYLHIKKTTITVNILKGGGGEYIVEVFFIIISLFSLTCIPQVVTIILLLSFL